MNRSGFLLPSLLFLTLAPLLGSAEVRHYYIAAEDVDWDYAPSGRDVIHDRTMPAPWAGKTRFRKTRYVEYTDATFTKRKPQPAWLGILGPILRAEVGDTIVVDFLNRSSAAHSLHPHGLRYDKQSEGSLYAGAEIGARVPPTARFTYRWIANQKSGPGPNDPSSKVWMYHSHVEEELEMNQGLMGPIIVTAKGKAKADGAPKDVDRELVTLFQIFDEGVYPPNTHSHIPQDQDLFHTINGYVFGNLPELVARQGEKVRWHLIGMGSEKDLHTPHWHGETVRANGRNTDVIELLPASMVSVDMVADNPDSWLFHCQVSDHMEGGMMAIYTIQPPPRRCPIRFDRGDFWRDPKADFALQVTNTSGKTINRLELGSEALIAPQNLRPYYGQWQWNKPLLPKGEITLQSNHQYMHDSAGMIAWVFYPSRIVFTDGSEWKPQQRGECFSVFWRDKEHPKMTVLPPLQLDSGDPD